MKSRKKSTEEQERGACVNVNKRVVEMSEGVGVLKKNEQQVNSSGEILIKTLSRLPITTQKRQKASRPLCAALMYSLYQLCKLQFITNGAFIRWSISSESDLAARNGFGLFTTYTHTTR